MENISAQAPYHDSPPTSRSSSPVPVDASSPTKPLPSLPTRAPVPPAEPYRDDPLATEGATVISQPHPRRYQPHRDVQVYCPPYTDALPSLEDNDDVPLAHLYPYPTEAPPAYHVVVRQSYRDTLISHIPTNSDSYDETDEEAATETEHHDDIRFKVERVVASIIIAIVLLIITALLAALALIYNIKVGRLSG